MSELPNEPTPSPRRIAPTRQRSRPRNKIWRRPAQTVSTQGPAQGLGAHSNDAPAPAFSKPMLGEHRGPQITPRHVLHRHHAADVATSPLDVDVTPPAIGQPAVDAVETVSPIAGGGLSAVRHTVGRVAKRTVTLSADAVVLTLAAPFFAVYFSVKAIRKLISRQDETN